MMTNKNILILFTLALVACGQPVSEDPTMALTDECVEMLDVTFACTAPDHEVSDADRQKCHDGAVAAVAAPGCVEVAHEELACLENFFASYGQCAPALPMNSQVYQDLHDYAASHCPSLLTPETAALHCPDFT